MFATTNMKKSLGAGGKEADRRLWAFWGQEGGRERVG